MNRVKLHVKSKTLLQNGTAMPSLKSCSVHLTNLLVIFAVVCLKNTRLPSCPDAAYTETFDYALKQGLIVFF